MSNDEVLRRTGLFEYLENSWTCYLVIANY